MSIVENSDSREVEQVNDCLETLDQIIEDAKLSVTKFDAQSASRWLGYSEEFLDLLKTEGLKNFRSSRSFRNRFGATDRNPDFSRRSPDEMFHAVRALFLGAGAVKVDDLPCSRIGNPEGFEIDGRFYTLSWLNYYCRYAYVSKFVKFDRQVIIEIGLGPASRRRCLSGLTLI
jgi:hypothetical protein